MLTRIATAALIVALAAPVTAHSQQAAAPKAEMKHSGDPATDLAPLMAQYGGWFLKGAEQVAEADYAYKPTAAVRSFGQLVGHLANGNFAICAGIRGEKSPGKADYEKVTDKATLVAAVRESNAYCATVHAWAKDHHHDAVSLFGMNGSVTWALGFNVAHVAEHYGNMVTYMRMKGMVPPSSQGN
jgi:uncharacterized damage-inducible protein DinB